MGINGYRKDDHHPFDVNPQRSVFLPMLCSRPSQKNAAIPSSGPLLEESDPPSPKIGCMGQVKKRSGRVTGLPTPYNYKLTNHSKICTIKANNWGNIVISCSRAAKYTKLVKLFSSKTLAGTATSTPSSAVAAATGRRRSVTKSGSSGTEVGNMKETVNIGEMDPPLPVVKKVRRPEEEEEEGESLWRRRFGEVAPHLRSLEIQRNNPRHHLQLVTV